MIPPDRTLDLTRAHESTAANTFRLTATPPVFVRGEGPYLYASGGARYLDLVCGSSTTNLGHGHPAHVAAITAALETGILHTGTRLPSPFRAALYERLAAILPEGLTRIQLVNSGAEAIEAAIKAAQYATGRHRLVAFDGGYHGRTLGALSLTSGARIRAPFHLLQDTVDILPFPDAQTTVTEALTAAERLLDGAKARSTLPALVLVEAIQGVAGVLESGTEFLQGLRALCTRFDVPLAVDEIWNGFGRVGDWFAYRKSGITPDMVVMGKALSGGLPLAAVAATDRLLGQWPPGMHTSTFQGNPLACAMAVATIDTIQEDRLLHHVTDIIEPVLKASLAPLASHPGIDAVRICGAQAAIAFADPERSVTLQNDLLKQNILAYGGGSQGECLMILPPINIPELVLRDALDRIIRMIRK